MNKPQTVTEINLKTVRRSDALVSSHELLPEPSSDRSSSLMHNNALNQPAETNAPTGPLVSLNGPVAGPPTAAAAFGEQTSPAELIAWGLKKFADDPIVLTTSFGMEGCVLMDLASQAITENGLKKLTVACIDTGFFFPETHQLRKKLIERYPNLDFVTWETSVSIAEQAETYGDQLWKNNPNMCCNIRKVQPMQDNIHEYKVWITALRRSQTEKRKDIPVLGWDWRYELLKFCPLATWTRADVWNYIQEHDVPFNQLHLQNYPSISCFHCTKPVDGSSPDAEVREGRWAGKDKTECGLHYSI